MKLSRLYTNKPLEFSPINFLAGLNVVMAEIRLPENRKKDTHNLGKSTLGRVLDFCFLLDRDSRFFLFKHQVFQDFVFFLEIQLPDSSYVTVRRAIREASKVSFKKHEYADQDYSTLGESGWDHHNVAFERARTILDGLLDWRGLSPWSFRNGLGYLLRSQEDFQDVFRLSKFGPKHSQWKPFLAHLLGFDGELVENHYSKEEELAAKKLEADTLNKELGGSVADLSKIEGIILLKQNDAEKKTKLLESFDFRSQDKQKTKQLVEETDQRIADLNGERYSLNASKKKIVDSLKEDEILFDPELASQLFEEAGILFSGQLKKDFQQLVDFNKAITEERRTYLETELIEIEADLKNTQRELSELGKRRSQSLSHLSETDVFERYKQESDLLVSLRAEIQSLERQRGLLHRLQEIRGRVRTLEDECGALQTQIESNVEGQNSETTSMFSNVRVFFSEIVEEVIDRKALLSVSPNKDGHLDFKAEILDESGTATSADLGHSYRKLLCIAFDLALLRAHLGDKFPQFVYHDGVLESLDDRKKENLLGVLRRYADLGLQLIITLIDSDLPRRGAKEPPVFDPSEIVLLLHDQDESGRLFKMASW